MHQDQQSCQQHTLAPEPEQCNATRRMFAAVTWQRLESLQRQPAMTMHDPRSCARVSHKRKLEPNVQGPPTQVSAPLLLAVKRHVLRKQGARVASLRGHRACVEIVDCTTTDTCPSRMIPGGVKKVAWTPPLHALAPADSSLLSDCSLGATLRISYAHWRPVSNRMQSTAQCV
jgi:hypothetical protein